MTVRKKRLTHGGARPGAGRKKRAGVRQRGVAMPEAAWKRVKRLAAKRKARGEKNVSPASVAGELVETALVYVPLEPEKRAQLEAFARERGVPVDQLVSEAISLLLRSEKR